MGDYIYLFSMMLIGIALGIFMLWRQLKQKNAKYEADLARFNTQSESPVAALDEAGRPISPETLIRSFRSSQLLDGWLTVALAGFGLFSSVVLVLHATDHFGGERLSQVRGQFIFLAVACLSWLVTAVFTLRTCRWVIWTGIGLSGLFAVISMVVVLDAVHSQGRPPLFPILCLLKLYPALTLARATWRMTRAGIPLGILPAGDDL